jgi:hypothetical protein
VQKFDAESYQESSDASRQVLSLLEAARGTEDSPKSQEPILLSRRSPSGARNSTLGRRLCVRVRPRARPSQVSRISCERRVDGHVGIAAFFGPRQVRVDSSALPRRRYGSVVHVGEVAFAVVLQTMKRHWSADRFFGRRRSVVGDAQNTREPAGANRYRPGGPTFHGLSSHSRRSSLVRLKPAGDRVPSA